VAAAAVTALKGVRQENPWQADAWRLPGTPVTVALGYQGRTVEARVERLGTGGWRVEGLGGNFPVRADPSHPARFIVANGDGRRVLWAVRTPAGIEVFDGGHRYVFEVGRRSGTGAGPVLAGAGGFEGLTAPLPGVLVKLGVREGDRVDALQAVAVLEAMKMEHVVHAPRAGRVCRVYFREGDKIPKGAVLLDLE
jgi:3-methylcrotonyl-CoA carboxylase alpha subunit